MISAGKSNSLLSFRVGPVLCCAPSLPVLSIITPPKLTHLPGSDHSNPGIFKHGAKIVKAFDLRLKFGIDPSEQTQPGNLVITTIGENSIGFWVDQILDVIEFPTQGWGNLPALVPQSVFSRTLVLNKAIHLYSEFEKLATINDLGYLRHYILQLKPQVGKLPDEEAKILEPEKVLPDTGASKAAVEPLIEIKSKATNVNPVPAIEKLPATEEIHRNDVTLPRPCNVPSGNIAIEFRVKPPQLPPVNKPTGTKENTPSLNGKSLSSRQLQPSPANERIETPVCAERKPAKEEPLPLQPFYSTEPVIDDEYKTPVLGISLMLILILGCLGAGVYYLLSDNRVTQAYEYKKEKPLNTVVSRPSAIKIEEPEKIVAFEPTNSIENKSDSIPQVIVNNGLEEDMPDTEISAKEKTLYRAEINQQDKDTIITIYESETSSLIQDKNNSNPETIVNDPETSLPDTEFSLNENLSYRVDISQQDNDTSLSFHESDSAETPENPLTPLATLELKKEASKETQLATPPEIISREVIHIVVKGDTLWAIANKYVNNPFLYPELARLSNIKNPHRIYPGNRVRIRFLAN